MTRKPLGLALATATVMVVGLILGAHGEGEPLTDTPYWQLQGTAPAAPDPQEVTDLRVAARAGQQPVVVTAQ